MLSLYRAWLGPGPCVARPAPPPGAHRPVPRRARPRDPTPPAQHPHHAPHAPHAPRTPPAPPSPPPPASPCSSASSELDVERVEPAEPPRRASGAVIDVASCDGPVRFSRVLNAAWRDRDGDAASERGWPCRHRKASQPRATLQYYPCKTCGSKFPSYYFVHKHRKRCHADEPPATVASVASVAPVATLATLATHATHASHAPGPAPDALPTPSTSDAAIT